MTTLIEISQPRKNAILLVSPEYKWDKKTQDFGKEIEFYSVEEQGQESDRIVYKSTGPLPFFTIAQATNLNDIFARYGQIEVIY